jgi:hypothetical protein
MHFMLGSYALHDNISGYGNIAAGLSSLEHNYNGVLNTAIGTVALINNHSGSWNTGIGTNALGDNVSGSANTACGYGALSDNTNGYNTAVGYTALSVTTNSQYNTAVGYDAGDSYDNGYNNVFIGANTEVTSGGFYNVIAIGQGTTVNNVSTATFGNSATIAYQGWANWTNISDGRFKRNIKENVPGIEFISKLRPVTYTLAATELDDYLHKKAPLEMSEEGKKIYDKALKEKEVITYTGFIAQEVEAAAKDLGFDFSGVDKPKNNDDTYGLRYAEFVVPLVKAVQELNEKNSKLELQNTELISKMENMESEIENIKAEIGISTTVGMQSAVLYDNSPNPFTDETVIRYYLPVGSTSLIKVADSEGREIMKQPLTKTGYGELYISKSTLSAGNYTYTLIVNGKEIESKTMILTK